MSRDLFSRYVWIVDTISQYGTLTRERLNELWMRSHLSEGKPIPERTFFHYRRAIEEIFNIDIVCDSAGQYSVQLPEGSNEKAFSNWLLDSYAISNAIAAQSDASAKVMVDDVPSAREFLAMTLEAARNNEKILFSYAGFNRSRIEEDIAFHPYFLRLYKQRWYMIGRKEKENEDAPSRGIRTYALDRVKAMRLTGEKFRKPKSATPETFFENIIGVTTSHGNIYDVQLKVTPTEAKYLRALPLHHSQWEQTHHEYSIFSYRLKLNYELVHEILSLGSSVEVLGPPELRVMLLNELSKLNSLYHIKNRD